VVATVPQVTSSAKISSLPLVVGLRIVGQQQRPVIILASVFCASGLTTIRPWNTGVPAILSTDSAKDLTAGTARHRVIHEQRGVGVLLAVEEIDAVGFDPRAFAGERNRRLSSG